MGRLRGRDRVLSANLFCHGDAQLIPTRRIISSKFGAENSPKGIGPAGVDVRAADHAC